MHNDTNRREPRSRFQFGREREQQRDLGRHDAGPGGPTRAAEGEASPLAEPVRRAPRANMANLSLEARSGRAQVGREVQSAEAVLRGYPAGNKQPFRAPKGYVRSDQRLQEAVWEALSECEALELNNLEISVQEGEVTLTGTVPERGMKYLAEQLAEDVGGVRDVHNQLKVSARSEQ